MSKSKIKLIATILVVAAILGTILGVVGYFSNGFKTWDKFNPKNWFNKNPIEQNEQVVSGAYINPSINNGIAVTTALISTNEYNTNNISDSADSAYKLTATIDSTQTRNLQIDWFVSWQKESTFSGGKNVSDYLTLSSSTTQSGESVTLICHQDFGEKINIVATSNLDKTKKAFCVVDYIKKIKSITYEINGENVAIEDNALLQYDFDKTTNAAMSINCKPVYSNYTIDTEYTMNVTGNFTEAFGFGQDKKFDSFNFSKGYNIAYLAIVSSGTKAFVENVYSIYSITDEMEIRDYADYVIEEYNSQSISASDMQNKYVADVCTFVEALESGDINTNRTSVSTFISRFEEICAPDYNFDVKFNFMGIDFSDIEDFIVKAIQCSQNGIGIAEYTVTMSSDNLVYSKIFKIGYTANSFDFFKGLIDLPPNIII